MSIQVIIQSLNKLVMIHKEFIVISKEKTELIKEGSVERLQKLLVQEQRQVRKLEKAEVERSEVVAEWFTAQGLQSEEMSVTYMLELLTDEEDYKKLEETIIELTKDLTTLKQQEQLNSELIRQSMQFIQISLNTMNPTISNLNYDNKQRTESPKRSIFDSKA